MMNKQCQMQMVAVMLRRRPTLSLALRLRERPVRGMHSSAAGVDISKSQQQSSKHTQTVSHPTVHTHMGRGMRLLLQHKTLVNTQFCRYKSNSAVTDITNLSADASIPTNYLPDPPSMSLDTVTEQLNVLGEPALSSLGLCSNYTPSGWIQSLLEYIHVSGDYSWGTTIVMFAVGIRICIIPLQMYTMKKSLEQQHVLPKYQQYQTELNKAAIRGDNLQAHMLTSKIKRYQKEKNVNPMASMYGMIYQGVLFVSIATALRGMANLPVESMTTGGFLWFADLTVCDPYWVLAGLTGASMLAVVELGAEGFRSNSMSIKARWLLRGGIGLGVPLLLSFAPSALGLYWLISNVVSIGTMTIIKTPVVRKKFGIPDSVKPKPMLGRKVKKASVFETVKQTYKETTTGRAAQDKANINARAFANAGQSQPVKTYKYDPTKASAR